MFLQLFQALATRSNHDSLLRIGVFSNRLMWMCIAVIVALQLALLYVPVLQRIMHLVPLTAGDLGVCIGAGAVLFLAIEGAK